MPLTRDDYATLEVQSAIFHDLPRQKAATPITPVLSEVATNLSEASRQHIRAKLVDTLQSMSAYGVQFREDASVVSSSVPIYLNRPKYEESDFVGRSQSFAEDLFKRQGPAMSAGLLCVVACTVNGRSAIALMKIEREEGAQLELTGCNIVFLSQIVGVGPPDMTVQRVSPTSRTASAQNSNRVLRGSIRYNLHGWRSLFVRIRILMAQRVGVKHIHHAVELWPPILLPSNSNGLISRMH